MEVAGYIILAIILMLVLYFTNPLDILTNNVAKVGAIAKQAVVQTGEDIDKGLGGMKDLEWCNNIAKRNTGEKCNTKCVVWPLLENSASKLCYNDFGDGWVSNGEKGQGNCAVGQGRGVCKLDPGEVGKKYMKGCPIWDDIQNSGNAFCMNDFGAGYVYTGQREQAECSVGFGRGKCKYDESKKSQKYINNCRIWPDVEPNGNFDCYNDFGPGYKMISADRGGCTVGFGKALCDYDKSIKDKKYMSNCVIWNDIEANGNAYCKNDFGEGWVYTGERDRGGCVAGFGKGQCKYDESKKNQKYLKDCRIWPDVEPNGNFYCYNDFGPGYKMISADRGGCLDGQGKALCDYDDSAKNKKYMNNCVVWNDIEANGNKYCKNDFGDGWVYTGERDRGGCTAGFGKGQCKYDESTKNQKYLNNCVIWNDIEPSGNFYCYNDFGSGYKMIGADRAGCTAGFGKALCDYDPSKQGYHYWKNCSAWGDTDSRGDEWCKVDFGQNYRKVGAERADCGYGRGKAVCGPA